MNSASPLRATEVLSVREKLGYSLGDLAANLIFQTLVTYLAFFYTDVYALPAATVATTIVRRPMSSIVAGLTAPWRRARSP